MLESSSSPIEINSEKDVQSACLCLLRLHPLVAWVERINSGAFSGTYHGKNRFVRFSFSGCSDIIGQLKDGRFLAIEIKRPEFYKDGHKKNCENKLTEDQKNFLEKVEANGGAAQVVDSLDDLEWFLNSLA